MGVWRGVPPVYVRLRRSGQPPPLHRRPGQHDPVHRQRMGSAGVGGRAIDDSPPEPGRPARGRSRTTPGPTRSARTCRATSSARTPTTCSAASPPRRRPTPRRSRSTMTHWAARSVLPPPKPRTNSPTTTEARCCPRAARRATPTTPTTPTAPWSAGQTRPAPRTSATSPGA